MINGLRQVGLLGWASAAFVAAAMLIGFTSVAQATIQSGSIDLQTAPNIRLDGAAGSLSPTTFGDTAGYSVSAAGDVNGDGSDDVIIGAPYAGRSQVEEQTVVLQDLPLTPGGSTGLLGNGTGRGLMQVRGGPRSGLSYVVFGGPSLNGVIDLANVGQQGGVAGFRIDGAHANDLSGLSVAGAGDVNGDQLADVIVGAPGANNNYRKNSGSAYLIFGKTSTGPVALADFERSDNTQGFRIDGATDTDWAGWSVAGAGDFSGDGRPDVIVGAPAAGEGPFQGSAYLVHGKSSPDPVDLANLSAQQGIAIKGAGGQDMAGYSVAGAGNVIGDSRPDLIVGAPRANNSGRVASGSAYVVSGGVATDVHLVNVGTPGDSEGFRIDGAAGGPQADSNDGDLVGSSVAGAGDLNGDGTDDVIVGAPNAYNNGRHKSGSAYMVFGGGFGPTSTTRLDLLGLGNHGFRIDGASGDNSAGFSVAGTGDVNGDGRPDVLIGSRCADPTEPLTCNPGAGHAEDLQRAGAVDVVFGKAGTGAVDLANLGSGNTEGVAISGVPSSAAGWSVAGAGDVNADGAPDFMLGAPFADNNSRTNSGSVYIIPGLPQSPQEPPEQPATEQELGALDNECLTSLQKPQASVSHWKQLTRRRLAGKAGPRGFFARLVVAPGAYSVLTDRTTPVKVQTQRTPGSPKSRLSSVAFSLDGKPIGTRKSPYTLLLKPGMLTAGTHTIAATLHSRKGKTKRLSLKFRASHCESAAFSASMIGKNVNKVVRVLGLRVQSGGPALSSVDFTISRHLKVSTSQLRRGRRIGTIDVRNSARTRSRKALIVRRRSGRSIALVGSAKLRARLVPGRRGGAKLSVTGLNGFNADMVDVRLDGRRTGLFRNPAVCARHQFGATLATASDQLTLNRSLQMCKGLKNRPR